MKLDSEKDVHQWLMRFVETREDAAFTKVAEHYGEMIYASAYRICGNAADSKDVLQQVLVVLAKKAPELTEVKSLGAWLHRVTVRTAQQSVRNQTRRMQREQSAAQSHDINREGMSLARKVSPELDESLNALREKDREVLTMHYLEGLTFKRIAEVLGASPDACQKRSVRALEKLASKLKSRGVVATGVALGASLQQVKATSHTLDMPVKVIAQQALQQAGTTGAASGTGLLIQLGFMKAGTVASVAVSVIGGFVISAAWGNLSQRQAFAKMNREEALSGVYASKRASSRASQVGFSLELVAKEIQRFDTMSEPRLIDQSRMRSLMFTVPDEYMPDVLSMLEEVENVDRFQDVVAAYFGRYAELSPELAAKRAMSMGEFAQSARLGALYTWLDLDAEVALNQIIVDGYQGDYDRIKGYVSYKMEADPVYASEIVDAIEPHWPKGDHGIRQMVASKWAVSDHEATADWLAATENDATRKALLREIARQVGRVRGFEGLHVADHIKEDAARAEARNFTIYWWGISVGGWSVNEKSKPRYNLTKGFPEDWTEQNVRTFSKAFMINFKHKLPDLVKVAQTDRHRQLVYQSVVLGYGYSDPASASHMVAKLDDSFAGSDEGKKTLKIFARRWHEKDKGEFYQWIGTLPEGRKKEIMQEELNIITQP